MTPEGQPNGRDDPVDDEPVGEVLSVRFGRSANCSSVGSVVDVLFVSSVVGTALLAALAVTLRSAGGDPPRPEGDPVADDDDGDGGDADDGQPGPEEGGQDADPPRTG